MTNEDTSVVSYAHRVSARLRVRRFASRLVKRFVKPCNGKVIDQHTELLVRALVGHQSTDHSDWLRIAFNSLVGRVPDPEAEAVYLAGLNSGSLSRRCVANAVATSDEYAAIASRRKDLLDQYAGGNAVSEDFDRLISLQLEITTFCNLKCAMCEKSWAPAKNFRHLSPEILPQIDMLNEDTHVALFGFGEPLMNPSSWEVLRGIPNASLCGFTTNGTLLTDKVCQKIVESGIGWINVSLDGATKETVNQIRGTGERFEYVLEQIRHLINARTELPRVTINMTVMKQNVDEILAFCELAHALRADGVLFAPLNPTISSGRTTTSPIGEAFDYDSSIIMACDTPRLERLLVEAKTYCDARGIDFSYAGDYFPQA